MEEEIGVKVTVTRLRRRLSVESEDVKSPSTQSTPTKKRGAKLAAKPQLELIDENATETVPKRTRKSIARDVTESTDEKPVTPARRSTRIKSNTSVLSETPSTEPAEEKAMTPGRRSARIRSNTSLVSETTQNYDSPRAKRAARRTSQVGSDTEAPITPARQTRRTRKDSASSVDKAEINIGKVGTQINEIIAEEVETNVKETNNNNNSQTDSLLLRKSPRLKKKGNRKSSTPDLTCTPDIENKENKLEKDKELSNTVNAINEESEKNTEPAPIKEDLDANKKVETDQKNISITSAKLIEQMDTQNKKAKSNMNKSTSEVEESNQFTSKRQRTKSWTEISVPHPNDSIFYSDTEVSKKKNKRASSKIISPKKLAPDDDLMNSSPQKTMNENIKTEDFSINSSIEKKKKRLSEKALLTDDLNQSIDVAPSNKPFSDTEMLKSTEKNNLSATEKFFEQAPCGVLESLVYIDDSDSNISIGKEQTKRISEGDQCIPTVVHQLEKETSEQPNYNNSCEPMDIDETIPEIASTQLAEKNTTVEPQQQDVQNRKSSVCPSKENESINEISNKSKRKSSINNTESQSLNGTENENKSTLVLSQIKDITTNEVTVETNSTKDAVDTYDPLSKSADVYETLKNKDLDKKNLSLNYSTSTPLQQKSLKKLGMQINTSIITPNDKSKKEKDIVKNNEKTILSQKDDSVSEHDEVDGIDSEVESSEEKSKLIDDEVEEASDDYESGDSRDEEERQYEEDNQIREEGETLSSDDEEEYSEDSDYEKDSFVVSFDEDDENLLCGSGDDLSMSADELSMTTKSKKKYNDRKIKEQKKASREMFEARHQLNESDKSKKSKSKKVNRLDSSDSEHDNDVEKKENRRQKIDSSPDISTEIDKSISKKKKKTRRLSDSVCGENVPCEKEITICNEKDVNDDDPLLLQNAIKEEPKTPRKSLDITTVQITNMEEIENIHINENVSMLKVNETSDPLQVTSLQNNEESGNDSDIESISENEEITHNYESMLNNLNNIKFRKNKSLDLSLNINKKVKQKNKEPVIDQLNLTRTKQSKKNKKKSVDLTENDNHTNEINKRKNISGKLTTHNEDSSDSIDMKLLFPEDSNDSETHNTIKQKKDAKEVTKDDITNNVAEDFIPLKRTEAKTNILENKDLSQPDETIHAKQKKNKHRKSSQTEQAISINDQDDNDVSFFVDTAGTHGEENDINVSLNKSSAKKNKNKRHSESLATNETNVSVSNIDKIEFDLSTQNSVTKNKKKSLTNTSGNKDNIFNNEVEEEDNSAKINTSKNSVEIKYDTNEVELEVMKSAKKNKDKNKHLSKEADGMKEVETSEIETSIKQSAKKNKKNDNNMSLVISPDMEDNFIEANSPEHDTSAKQSAKKKKYKKNNQSLESTQEDLNIEILKTDTSIKNSAKKNKNNSISMTNVEDNKHEISQEEPNASLIKSTKKNRNTSLSFINTEENEAVAVINDEAVEMVIQSEKKKKKKKSLDVSQTNIETRDLDGIDSEVEPIHNSFLTNSDGKKKKNSISESQIAEETEEKCIEIEEAEKSVKRKRKSSANHTQEDILVEDESKNSNVLTESISSINQKKKQKISHSDEVLTQNEGIDKRTREKTTVKKSKKKIKLNQGVDIDQSKENILTSSKKESLKLTKSEDQSHSEAKKVSKRKARDDDDSDKTSKVLKQNSFDKVHVPRLPASVLKQLEDKPRRENLETRKANVISTTSFVVEDTKKKKNKPSNYLEQSVYLNETLEKKKLKSSIKTPKVLPFIPTASTSDSGFTTNFRINVVPQEPQFIAQSYAVANFKNEYLHTKKIKKLGTFEKYKRQRNVKMSKF